jgi:hypothetical protein
MAGFDVLAKMRSPKTKAFAFFMTVGLTTTLICDLCYRYVDSSPPIIAWLQRLLVSYITLYLVLVLNTGTVPDLAFESDNR